MSTRYYNRWVKAHVRHGGWGGPATLRAVEPLAAECAANGYSTDAAGRATALAYLLHSEREFAREERQGLQDDARRLARGETLVRDYL